MYIIPIIVVIFVTMYVLSICMLSIKEKYKNYCKNYTKPTTFRDVVLNAHNDYRLKHNVGPLEWNTKLESDAKKWATQLCDSHSFMHSDYPYGENLATGTDSKGVKQWYDEAKLYDYNKPGFSPSTGHFTQLVWKGTTQIGCAYADKDSKGNACTVSYSNNNKFSNVPPLVCEYYPTGNGVGFKENVLPAKY